VLHVCSCFIVRYSCFLIVLLSCIFKGFYSVHLTHVQLTIYLLTYLFICACEIVLTEKRRPEAELKELDAKNKITDEMLTVSRNISLQ